MRADCIYNTNFQGRLVITNHLSKKPNKCINEIKSTLDNLIQTKDYNFYIAQDYCKNEICISAGYPFPRKYSEYAILLTDIRENIPANSKASKYISAAENIIERQEASTKKQQELQWEKEQKQQDLKEIGRFFAAFMLCPIVMFVGEFVEQTKDITKELKKMFNKAKKLAIKKG